MNKQGLTVLGWIISIMFWVSVILVGITFPQEPSNIHMLDFLSYTGVFGGMLLIGKLDLHPRRRTGIVYRALPFALGCLIFLDGFSRLAWIFGQWSIALGAVLIVCFVTLNYRGQLLLYK